MKETFFFSHDLGARNDPKLQDVLMTLGCAGIGAFWCVIEQLYEQDGYLPLTSCKTIAFALHVDIKDVEALVNDFGLFDNDGEKFWSNSVISRLGKRADIAEKRKKAAASSWESRRAKQMQSNCNANSMVCNAIKVKESKVKESKEDNNISISIDIPENKFPADYKNKKKDEVDFKKVVDLYHTLCPSYSKIIKLSDARKQKIRIRLEEMKGDFKMLESIFTTMESSKFLKGDNRSGWKATFDWVFENSKNWVKIAEGNYNDNKADAGTKKCNDEWT